MIAQNSRSDTASEITKDVVALARSFLSLKRARTVRRFPMTPTKVRMTAALAAKLVRGTENVKVPLCSTFPKFVVFPDITDVMDVLLIFLNC